MTKITDPKVLYKYIWAFSLGDGGLYIPPGGKNARFQATQIIDNKDYIEWRADILSNITTVTLREVESKRPNEKKAIITQTKTHPKFTTVHSRLYFNHVKIIDPHQIKYFDAEVMAILYQDDGCLWFNKARKQDTVYRPCISIATYNFSYNDVVLLGKTMYEKFGLRWNLQRKNIRGKYHWIVVLKRTDTNTFIQLVKPYIKPSFYRKIDLSRMGISDYYKSDGDIVRTV